MTLLSLSRVGAGLLVTVVCGGGARAQQAEYHYIGHLGGSGDEVARPYGIGDGPVVIGTNDNFDNDGNFRRAFVWRAATGIAQLAGTPTTGVSSGAYAISPDGSTVIGVLGIAPGSGGSSPLVFRRIGGGANETLALQPGMFYPQVTGISDDGGTVVGIVNGYGGGGQAVVWRGAGSAEVLPNLPGAPASQALAVNGDGTVIVGWSGRGYPFDNMPVRWVNGVVEALGLPPGCNWGWAKAVSADAGAIVGSGWIGGASKAFMWTASEGMSLLEPLAPSIAIDASSISADGRFVAGRSHDKAVVWRDGKAYAIGESLVEPGTSVAPFASLTTASIISRDGKHVAGSERFVEGPGDVDYHAWLVTLPEWFVGEPCAADVNADGELDILDLLDFLDSFGECAGQPGPCAGPSGVSADFNRDAFVDIQDFLGFLDGFGAGC
jgi:uncharacterized membrane protein